MTRGHELSDREVKLLRKRIELGAQVLDEVHPGWVDRIDLEKLNLGSYSCCVVGQLNDGTFTGPSLRLARTVGCSDVAALGFDVYDSESYTELTEEWTALIEERRHLAA